MVGEFKEFISRGNVTDLAVGVIVGTAFTAIVNSLANDILMPLIGTFMGGIDLTKLSFTVNSFIFRDYSVSIAYGKFLQAVVTFLIIAVSVFFMVKMLNILRRKKDTEEPPKPDPQVLLLTEIRNLLKNIEQSTVYGEQLTFNDTENNADMDS
ncbi:MAG: large-conductance mechanosensitive channel protein MscL [Oscillospiraceae bacterium]|nr:large-conductance mechanosensitive channel protein MscL [Oscillospiraceae bacterium]